MSEWLPLLKEAGKDIREVVTPLAGLPEAGELVRLSSSKRTTRIDAEAAKVLTEFLESERVPCTLVSEEWGRRVYGKRPQEYLVVDELDGTSNAIRGVPYFATSLAVSSTPNLSGVHTALVVDLPRGIEYWAEKGSGAFADGVPLKPSSQTILQDSLVSVDISPIRVDAFKRVSPLLLELDHERHLGAAALELCHVASGTLDAYVDLRHKLRVTDVGAAYLILKESRCSITNPYGRSLRTKIIPDEPVSIVAAANRKLWTTIGKSLKP